MEADPTQQLVDEIIKESLAELDNSILRRIELGLPIDNSDQGFNSSNPP